MRSVTHRVCKFCTDWSFDYDPIREDATDDYLLKYGKHLEEDHPEEWKLLMLITFPEKYKEPQWQI